MSTANQHFKGSGNMIGCPCPKEGGSVALWRVNQIEKREDAELGIVSRDGDNYISLLA